MSYFDFVVINVGLNIIVSEYHANHIVQFVMELHLHNHQTLSIWMMWYWHYVL